MKILGCINDQIIDFYDFDEKEKKLILYPLGFLEVLLNKLRLYFGNAFN